MYFALKFATHKYHRFMHILHYGEIQVKCNNKQKVQNVQTIRSFCIFDKNCKMCKTIRTFCIFLGNDKPYLRKLRALHHLELRIYCNAHPTTNNK